MRPNNSRQRTTSQQYTEFKVKEKDELLSFIMKKMAGISRNSAKSLLTSCRVLVNMRITTQYNFELHPGMTVQISKEKGRREYHNKMLKIVYEDQYIIVVEKASGLLTIATAREKERTAYAYLNEYIKRGNPRRNIYIVHRLDKDTSGLLIFAKDETTKRKLQDNWNRAVRERKYVAVVCGEMEKDKGTVTSWLVDNKVYVTYSSPLKNQGEKAVTNYKTIKRENGYSLLEVELETGKKNQIRVHMKDLGHPIAGDDKYGNGDNPIGRLALHAFKISFYHPVTGEPMTFETPYPAEFKKVFQ